MRNFSSALALALSAAGCGGWSATNLIKSTDDPYARSPRSKGQKARNKRYRRH